MRNIFLCFFALYVVVDASPLGTDVSDKDITDVKKPFIDQLKENESMFIFFGKSGCFSFKVSDSGYAKLNIKRSKGNYFAFYQHEEKRLSVEDLQLIRKMESELDSVSRVMKCSNSDHYFLKHNKKTKSFIDNSCQWKGFESLTSKLFGK